MTGLHPEAQPNAKTNSTKPPGTESPRAASYDRVVAGLAYAYDGIFSTATIHDGADEARRLLEPDATIRTYLPVLTARFAKERLTAAARNEGMLATQVPELLFLCVHNSGRSQMPAALAEHLSGGRVRDIRDDLMHRVTTLLRELGI